MAQEKKPKEPPCSVLRLKRGSWQYDTELNIGGQTTQSYSVTREPEPGFIMRFVLSRKFRWGFTAFAIGINIINLIIWVRA